MRLSRIVLRGIVICTVPLSPGCSDDETNASSIYTADDALAAIADWKQHIVDEFGPGAVSLGAFQATQPGDVWHACGGTLHSRVDALDAHVSESPDLRMTPLANYEKTVGIHRKFSEHTSFGIDFETGEAGVKLVDATLAAAFSDDRVSTINIKLGLRNPMLVELVSLQQGLDQYCSAIETTGTPANAFVTSVLQAQVTISYTLFDGRGNRVELSAGLASVINQLPGIDASYVQESGEDVTESTVVESGDHPTSFAAIFREIPADKQTGGISCVPDEGQVAAAQQRVLVVTDGSGPLFNVSIEEGAAETFGREWFFEIEHVGNDPIALGGALHFRLRNRYGFLFDQLTCFASCMPNDPGAVTYWQAPPQTERLNEVSFEAFVE